MKNNDYSDIIGMSPPVSHKHPPMPLSDRAAQFAPFAALTGFGAVICEEARLTDRQRVLSDDDARELDESLRLLIENIRSKPLAEITYFVPDLHKSGGSYVTVTAPVRRVDEVAREIELTDKSRICFESIYKITLRQHRTIHGERLA